MRQWMTCSEIENLAAISAICELAGVPEFAAMFVARGFTPSTTIRLLSKRGDDWLPPADTGRTIH
jgi:hypothetical protein